MAEAGWDLSARDLRAAPFNFDPNTALERRRACSTWAPSPVTNWYQCTGNPPTGDGCNATGGYLNLLAVDDDNGNLADGTPHMTAIFAAFNRHQIACPTPAAGEQRLRGRPQHAAPVVTATARDQGATLTWTAGAGRRPLRRLPHRGRPRLQLRQGEDRRDRPASPSRDGDLRQRQHATSTRSCPSAPPRPASAA